MNIGNLLNQIPDSLDKEFFETLAQSKHIHIERIVSKGHSSPESGWYDQDQNEWVMVLQGHAIIYFHNGEETQLNAGDYINIPAHKKHRVEWTDLNQDTIWLAVYYL